MPLKENDTQNTFGMLFIDEQQVVNQGFYILHS